MVWRVLDSGGNKVGLRDCLKIDRLDGIEIKYELRSFGLFGFLVRGIMHRGIRDKQYALRSGGFWNNNNKVKSM